MPQESETEYYPLSAVAAALGVSRVSAFRYVKAGKLAAIRIGRGYYVSDFAYRDYLVDHVLPPGIREALAGLAECVRREAAEGTAQEFPPGLLEEMRRSGEGS
ncbi:hypothetical protein HQ865_22660 [Mucilaginibacter mali]|uniref:Helix-turn-helix domain-containing protein n=1 Tax=Mucilaginibacter mali TaxID=2740462 RepID=A0A7D4PRH4_9SPHI|nr:hypothetical protein [Mucilaginibacter mali]QKJ28208.1 hypothetical protein HQ865_22660 [Mucilaginibacter mali]